MSLDYVKMLSGVFAPEVSCDAPSIVLASELAAVANTIGILPALDEIEAAKKTLLRALEIARQNADRDELQSDSEVLRLQSESDTQVKVATSAYAAAVVYAEDKYSKYNLLLLALHVLPFTDINGNIIQRVVGVNIPQFCAALDIFYR